MFKKYLVFILVLTMIVGMLVGCNGKTDDAKIDASEQSTEVLGEIAKVEQVINIGAGEEMKTLDPNLNNDSVGSAILNHAFEPLVIDDGSGKVIPGAAKSWKVNEDGTEITFKMDENAKWSDGKSVSAKDFEYSFKRIADPTTGSEQAGRLLIVENGEAVLEGEAELDALGVKAIDDSTLKIKFNVIGDYPLRAIANLLPVREDIVSGNPDRWSLNKEALRISNGPFNIVEWKPNEQVILEKNNLYRDVKNVKLDKMVYHFIPDSSTALSAYVAGKLDAVITVPDSQVQKLLVENEEFHLVPEFSLYYLEFNSKAKPVDDLRVRKALTLAVDRKAITEKVLGGGEMPATGIIPYGVIFDGVDFRKDRNKDENYDIDVNGANLEMAKELMAEVGYPNGEGFPGLVITCTAEAGSQRLTEAIVEMWRSNLGIEVEIEAMEGQVMIDKLAAGDFQISYFGIGGDFPHPLNILDMYMSGSGMNFNGYSNSDFDDFINKAKTAKTTAEVVKNYHGAEDLWMSQYVVGPLYYGTAKILIKDHVKDYKIIKGYRIFTNAYVEGN